MTIQIAPEALLLLILGCAAGLAVYRHTARAPTPSRGDLVGAIGAAVGVISVFALLLGLGNAGDSARERPMPEPTATPSPTPRSP